MLVEDAGMLFIVLFYDLIGDFFFFELLAFEITGRRDSFGGRRHDEGNNQWRDNATQGVLK